MGMYTTIEDGAGNTCQIKTGWDELETFRVGDTVPWRIIPDAPGEGHLLDGIYSGIGSLSLGERAHEGFVDFWVVIQNHVIVAMVEQGILLEDDESDASLDYNRDLARIEAQYPIQHVPRDMWPEEMWAAKEERHRLWQEECVKRIAERMAADPSCTPFQAAMVEAMRSLMGEVSIARRIFLEDKPVSPPAPHPEGEGIHPVPPEGGYQRKPVSFGLEPIPDSDDPQMNLVELVELAERRFEVVREVADPADARLMAAPLRRSKDYTGIARKTFTGEELCPELVEKRAGILAQCMSYWDRNEIPAQIGSPTLPGQRMPQQEIGRKLFPVEPLPDGAKLVSSEDPDNNPDPSEEE